MESIIIDLTGLLFKTKSNSVETAQNLSAGKDLSLLRWRDLHRASLRFIVMDPAPVDRQNT